jgi:ribosomal protein L3 glutamine methyltransferase
MNALPREYRHEPQMALAGGDDGMDLVRTVLREAARYLNPRGIIILEVGHNRDAAETAFPRMPFVWLTTASSTDSVFLLTREDLVAGR